MELKKEDLPERETLKEHLAQLMAKKARIEGDIIALQATIPENLGPLIDKDGFPRADIDIYAIRTTKHQIALLQTDHKALMKEIESSMYDLHSYFKSESDRKDTVPMKIQPSTQIDKVHTTKLPLQEEDFARENLSPVYIVDHVFEDSPASRAGLLIGDKILRFGNITKESRSEENMAGLVRENVGKPIRVLISREARGELILNLVPQVWGGRGLLGCHIQPVP